MMICYYWILKLKARFLSGDYAEALAAAGKVKPLLSTVAAQIQLLDYFYYAALTVAACYENAPVDEQQEWRDLLTAHREQLREWADSYPPTFGDKHALVSAEIARIEGRELDAERLYEQAILSTRENGFVQNEGLAHEVAARFYTARGFETIADAYFRNARYCYLRWGRGRQGEAARSASSAFGRCGGESSDGDHWLPGPAARCSDRRQSLSGRIQRDRFTQADRTSVDNRARKRRRGSRPSDTAGSE
jgi:hypothetical protein